MNKSISTLMCTAITFAVLCTAVTASEQPEVAGDIRFEI